MAIHTLRRRVAALGTVLGLGIAVPFAAGATPAYAQAQLEITKTHVGEFTRGGVGTYRVTVRNTGNEPTVSAGTRMLDVYPAGLTVQEVRIVSYTTDTLGCEGVVPQDPDRKSTQCISSQMEPGDSYVVDAVVFVPSDTPCTVTNTATVTERDGALSDSASHTVNIPGPNCNGGGGGNGGGGSILPINLSGLIPLFNNISINNNIHSPDATNVSNQTFGQNAH
ncbi:hypothetical protein MTF65_10040 [Streptomyces sp. APSN-46.1]|uniref:hypothetical protein n=1 Tax=Streptomyces sp. APSN-46.1 TaxID=2929049 RepID=UPI001FB424F5|nr:hypothetical protein [Streptomyces sp. APSN-46.1]MCJ1677672.1 hypothetical protein [Streptomyces sp. APSN-46.1]